MSSPATSTRVTRLLHTNRDLRLAAHLTSARFAYRSGKLK